MNPANPTARAAARTPSARWRAHALGGALACLLAACGGGGGGDSPPPSGGGAGVTTGVQFVLAPVAGGSCSAFNTAGTRVASPVTTSGGLANFTDLPTTAGLLQIACEGGTYTDEATGATLTAPKLRGYVQPAGSALTATVSPVTEIAVRLLGSRAADANFAAVLTQVAEAFGLKDIRADLVQATDLNNNNAADNAAGRYGIVLAALSQLQASSASGTTAAAVLDQLAAGFAADGQVKDDKVRERYVQALEALLGNSRMKTRVGSETGPLGAVFDNVSHEDLEAVVDYIATDLSLTREPGSALRVQAGKASTVQIVGTNLGLHLTATLGGTACRVRDIQSLEDVEIESDKEVMLADCPARGSAGSAAFVVSYGGTEVFRTNVDVTSDDLAAAEQARLARLRPVTGSVFGGVAATKSAPRLQATTLTAQPGLITGKVQGDAPTINTSGSSPGSLNYTSLRTFDVKGVVVELLDRANADAVLATTFTDSTGVYSFTGVPAGRNVAVRVKAQLAKTRAAGVTTGPQYNFMLRDNTAAGTVKPLYTLDSAAFTTVAEGSVVNVKAGLGFDGTGTVTGPRQSAPFSILEVVYAAAVNLEATDANLFMPDLNIYWSVNNSEASGDKAKGEISTSHYADSGDLPGVFILGKADADTDEFDQGVIGHEFGHYLQAQLSYSDSPGGSHSANEYKDASLAYGEGYGTAVGGLLSGSPFYTDSKGAKQAGGSLTNLNDSLKSTEARGFYAEGSIQTVMYRMGIKYGFNAFWKAITAMRGSHESATVFAFMNQFIKQNPAAESDVRALAATENIRTTDPFGELPAGTSEDTAINATASKGAGDLEQIYVKLALNTPSGDGAVNLTPSAPTFCVNRNLNGANHTNGLGMSKRFTFTANFTGNLGIRAQDGKGAVFSDQSTSVEGRDATGTKLAAYNWAGGSSMVNVVTGRVYTVKVQSQKPEEVLNGNRCGNQVSLWRVPD